MGSSFDTKTLVVNLGDPGGAKALKVLRAPSDSAGGGITIVEAYAVNHATPGAGTSFTLGLQRFSSAGTPAVNGTIAPAIGGTAASWTDGVPKEFTIDGDYASLDAGEWLVIDYDEQGTGNPVNGYVTVHYLLGR